MSSTLPPARRIRSALREFLHSEAAGGIVLMAVAALALITANSPIAESYFNALHAYLGPLSLQHWINDALMSVFFLLVGLEIKREMLEGQLSSWSRRILPGACAAGGMLVPALIYVAFNWSNPSALRGWAIPTATDIAFALGVISLLGPRVPPSLKIFLAALAIIDDLGAVLVIALFYTAHLNWIALAGAAVVILCLVILNRSGVTRLLPYIILGIVLWLLVFLSGIHATLAGVALALTIPTKRTQGVLQSPLQRLEHALHMPVAFLIVPIFGFANAGVSFAGLTPAVLVEPLTLGVAAGLVLGKLIGVTGTAVILVKSRLADLPAHAGWGQMVGVAFLCGIGFTMSLFIGLLAFSDPAVQDHIKLGILSGSALAGVVGYLILRFAQSKPAAI
jgi:NhaA family Na+:H+ antiporter